ncbi:MAG: hypothetical protein ACR2M6_02150 [Vampirovibrionia bacterium]
MMNTQIENKENKIVCTITCLEYSNRKCNGRIYVDTKRVRKLLVEDGHNPGLLIQDSRIDNKYSQLSGTWIFEDANIVKEKVVTLEEKPERTQKPRTSNNRRKNSRKSKKVLDNSVEDVIIEE